MPSEICEQSTESRYSHNSAFSKYVVRLAFQQGRCFERQHPIFVKPKVERRSKPNVDDQDRRCMMHTPIHSWLQPICSLAVMCLPICSNLLPTPPSIHRYL